MEVLYGHARLLAELGAGDVSHPQWSWHRVEAAGRPETTRYNVSWGFVEVLPTA